MQDDEGRIGASFAEFLDEQGIREDVEGQAVKELIAEQISAAMKAEGLSKVAMAERMQTTRARSIASSTPTTLRHAGHAAAGGKGGGATFDDRAELKF